MSERDDRTTGDEGTTQRTGVERGDEQGAAGGRGPARDQGDGSGQTSGRTGGMSTSAAGGTTGGADASGERGAQGTTRQLDAGATHESVREGVSDHEIEGGYGDSSGYEIGSNATPSTGVREPSVREDALRRDAGTPSPQGERREG